MNPNTKSIATGALAGAVAGALATFVMGFATTAMYDRESPQARQREDRARGGESAYETAARRGADLVGVKLSDDQKGNAATAIHYSVGILSAALYGALRRRIPGPALAKGLGFGSVIWLVADEMVTPLLGLTPGPGAFPWQTHARGLVGHLVYGLTTEGGLLAVDQVIGPEPPPA